MRIVLLLCLFLAPAVAGATDLSPSPARLAHGEFHSADDVANSARCGASGCHPDITEQWRASVHHHASFSNPFYRATVEVLMAEPDGVAKTRWCSGCHDPALLFTDTLSADLDPSSALAQEGVSCLTCHAMEEERDLRGNGGYSLPREPHLPSGPLADLRLKLFPAEHRDAMLRPMHRTAEFCLSCHKVSIPVELNGTHWRRGQNEYGAWHQSGVSGNSVSTFAWREEPLTCIDCHMPPVESDDEGNDDGRVRSHRFSAANSALPFLRGDDTQLEAVRSFLSRSVMRLDAFAVEMDDGPLLPLHEAQLEPASDVRLFVVVRNVGAGHEFPGGTIDSQEAWLRVRVTDATGRTLLESGELDGDGRIDPQARVYRARLVDDRGELVFRRDIQHWVATAARNVIGPGSSDVARYAFRLPSDVEGPLTVEAELLYRKFNPRYTAWVFRDAASVPTLPVVRVASMRTTLPPAPDPSAESRAQRWNDLGIGLFLQDDLRRAALAFAQVQRLSPVRIDGPLNATRVALAEGDLEGAVRFLDQARGLDPAHPTARWLAGRLHLAHGDLEAATRDLAALTLEYPSDHGLQAELAAAWLLAGDPERALACTERILAQDPEHLAAWSHRLTAQRQLGVSTAEAQAAVERYKAHEEEPALAGKWLRNNPLENLQAQVRWEYRAPIEP